MTINLDKPDYIVNGPVAAGAGLIGFYWLPISQINTISFIVTSLGLATGSYQILGSNDQGPLEGPYNFSKLAHVVVLATLPFTGSTVNPTFMEITTSMKWVAFGVLGSINTGVVSVQVFGKSLG